MSGELLRNDAGCLTNADAVKEQICREMNNIGQRLCPDYYSEKKEDVNYGKVEAITYFSKTTGCDRKANVLLPANYNKEKKYPVIYFMHGIFGDENSMIFEEANKLDIIFGNLVAEGEVNEAIVVFPNMFATGDPEIKPGFSAEGTAPYDNFINDLSEDLIPYIEETYPVFTDREHRAIMGFSMGGRETIYIGLMRSDLFDAWAAIAPAPGLVPSEDAMMKHDGQFTDREQMRFKHEEISKLVMISCGDIDGVVRDFPKTYHEIFEEHSIEHMWFEIPGADHNSIAIRSGYYNFLVRWKAIAK